MRKKSSLESQKNVVWAPDSLAEDFAFNDPWSNACGGSYHSHDFGATKEEYHGESWLPGYAGGQGAQRYANKSEKSFWEKRMEKHEQYMELSQKLWLKQQMLLSQDMRRTILDPDGKRAPYLAGVPASLLLSVLI